MHWAIRVVAGLAVLTSACQDRTELRPSRDAAVSEPERENPASEREGDRTESRTLLPVAEFPRLGDRPGYVAGGLLYVGLRVGEAQRFWDLLPKPDALQKDGMQAAAAIGFDPVAGEWGVHFSVAADAVISATVLRPLDTDIARYRRAPSGDAGVRAAEAMGYHTRVHVPSAAPLVTREALRALFDVEQRERGTTACAALELDACIVLGERGVLVLRDVPDAVVVDLVVFEQMLPMLGPPGAGALGNPTRLAVVRDALAVPTAVIPHAADLGGDAAVWLDPAVLAPLAAVSHLGRGDSLARLERFESLAGASRLFPGVGISVVYQESQETLHAVASWPVAGPLWGRLALRTFATPASTVSVPTIEALCESALACFRTRGLPDARPLAKRLLTGGFAKDFEEVLRILDRDATYTLPLLLGGAWLNVVAAATRAPESLEGAEAGIAGTVRDAALRAEGFGGVLRDYAPGAIVDYVLYARAARQDIDAAKGLLGLAGMEVKDVELPEGRGRATTLALAGRPESHAFLKADQTAFGWAAVASDAGGFARLLALDAQTPAGPLAYVEVPDVGRLIETMADADLLFARSWARGRRLQVELDLDGGAPRLRATLSLPSLRPQK